MRPRFGGNRAPPRTEGAGNAGCWPHPWPCVPRRLHLCARKQQQGSRHNRHSLRNGLRLIRGLLGAPGFLATVPSSSLARELIPASGDRDNTTSPSAPHALVFRARCVHRIPPPTFVTIAKRPSWMERDDGRWSYIYEKRKLNIFAREAWHKLKSLPIKRSDLPDAPVNLSGSRMDLISRCSNATWWTSSGSPLLAKDQRRPKFSKLVSLAHKICGARHETRYRRTLAPNLVSWPGDG